MSNAETGSEQRRKGGDSASARVIPILFLWPLLKFVGIALSHGCAQSHLVQQFSDFTIPYCQIELKCAQIRSG